MRILHIIDSMDMGGAQSLIAELAPVQKAMGHDVTVLQLLDSPDRTFPDRLAKVGVEVVALSSTRSVRSIANIFDLIPYIRRADVVHSHLFPANYWTALAKLAGFCRTPIVTTEHSTDNKRRKIALFRYIDAFIYARYNRVIACSDKAMETFKARFPRLECMSIPNGVDISRYAEAEPYSKSELAGIPEDSFVSVMVARFIASKRQDTLVRMLPMLPSRHHVVLVGGNEQDDGLMKVKELACSLGVEGRVHFLYTRPDVPRILKSCDAVVMSSEYEGLSLSSIEGMACGHPFIASDVNGLREVVGGAGVLVPCADAEALADVIGRLSTDPEYLDAVTGSCLARAAEYDIHAVATKYIEEYKHLIVNE